MTDEDHTSLTFEDQRSLEAIVSSEQQLAGLGSVTGGGGQRFRKRSITDITFINSQK
jgi:hypothetical protein